MSLWAFLSRRIVTPDGMRQGAVLVQDERILGVTGLTEVPAEATIQDFAEASLLPGLVDSHVHINEPGRSDWEGFLSATRLVASVPLRIHGLSSAC